MLLQEVPTVYDLFVISRCHALWAAAVTKL
jgi:hypothetical protein